MKGKLKYRLRKQLEQEAYMEVKTFKKEDIDAPRKV